MSFGSGKQMTKLERQWVDAVKRGGCLCCLQLGYPHDPDGHVVEANHLLSGGIRRGHLFTVGGCLWHHRGRLVVNGWNHRMHRDRLGPALSEGSVPFYRKFGTDEQQIERQDQLIARVNPTLVQLVQLGRLHAT